MGKTALLLLDLQQGVLDILSDEKKDYLTRMTNLIATARSANIPIIYIRTAFRPDYADLSPNNPMHARIAQLPGKKFIKGDPSTNFPPSIAPLADDIVITKSRVSAFTGTDLEVVLRSLGVDSLVMCGIATSGAVLATMIQAVDRDYKVTVLGDACLDRKKGVQAMLVEEVFAVQARVLRCEEWASSSSRK
jgi:nicotinamidase-related amidase